MTAESEAANPRRPGRRRLVALVDDDPSFLKALARLLKVHGYAVEAFGTEQEFLDSHARLAAHCLVLDVHMPNISGPELHDGLMASGVRIPAIFVTADPTPDVLARASRPGCYGVLLKPFVQEDLLRCLGTAMGDEEPAARQTGA